MATLKLGHSDEINDIQKQIEVYTKKIEHEKINLRLCNERYNSELELLMKLQNRKQPIKKKRSSSKKARQSVTVQPKRVKDSYLDNPNLLVKEVNKKFYDLEKIKSDLNKLILENRLLKKDIESLRKEKLGAQNVLDNITSKCNKTEQDIRIISNKNYHLKKDEDKPYKINARILKSLKELEPILNSEFFEKRDAREEEYKNLLSEDILREKLHKNEVLQKLNAHATKLTSLNRKNKDDNLLKCINPKDEEISDRTPVLDILIEKYKYFNKLMKLMIDKYTKNRVGLSDALERIMKFLGIEKYDNIPVILKKYEDQTSSIEMLLSKLSIELYSLEDKKRFINLKIQNIKNRSSEISITRNEIIKQKKQEIENLKCLIKDHKNEVFYKEEFFNSLKESTDEYLTFLEKTYIAEYIPLKTPINKDIVYNKDNIITIIANVEDYLCVCEEIEAEGNRSIKDNLSLENSTINKNMNNIIDMDIENLTKDIRSKVDNIKANNIIGELKGKPLNANFNEIIKNISDNIVKGNINNINSNNKYDKINK